MASTDRAEIQALVQDELASFRLAPLAPGSTVGVPWSEAKTEEHIAELRAALVTPYLQRFTLKDTFEQIARTPQARVDYWVVAEVGSYLEFYDPGLDEFGLACRGQAGSLPETIGVRGDLVGVFCAI